MYERMCVCTCAHMHLLWRQKGEGTGTHSGFRSNCHGEKLVFGIYAERRDRAKPECVSKGQGLNNKESGLLDCSRKPG